MLTQRRLKQLLDYNPETGLFRAKKLRCHPKGGTFEVGGISGGYLSIWLDKRAYFGAFAKTNESLGLL